MHALVKGAIAAAVIATVSLLVSRSRPPPPAPIVQQPSAQPEVGAAPAVLTEMPCPARHIPEGQACVPLPDPEEPLDDSGAVQRDRKNRGATYEVIPRKPDKSPDPSLYLFPLDDEPLFLRGFDQTTAPEVSPVSLEISAERGSPIRALALADQVGSAHVVAVGRYIGMTVVTKHEVPSTDRVRSYLLVHGHLDATAPDLAVGSTVGAGDPIGFVGDSGNPGIVSLYLEARLLREDATIEGTPIARLLDAAQSIPVDARNVLPLR